MTPQFVKFILECHFKTLDWQTDFKLIYKATRDGDDIESFWNKVDGKGNLFIFIKSTLNKSFGGFRSIAFQNAEKKEFVEKKDKDAYLFQLDSEFKS